MVKPLLFPQETHTQTVNNTEIILCSGVQYINNIKTVLLGEIFKLLLFFLYFYVISLAYPMVDLKKTILIHQPIHFYTQRCHYCLGVGNHSSRTSFPFFWAILNILKYAVFFYFLIAMIHYTIFNYFREWLLVLPLLQCLEIFILFT